MKREARRDLKNATFRVPRSTWQRAKKRAIDEDRSLNEVVVEALDAFAGPEDARESPMLRVLAVARRVARLQRPARPARTPSKDALHERER